MSDITLTEVVDQLEGYSANEIAALLLLADKKGHRSSETSCPMANYFYDVLGETHIVDNHTVYCDSGEYLTVDLPVGVVRFISTFDMGGFPELESGEDD